MSNWNSAVLASSLALISVAANAESSINSSADQSIQDSDNVNLTREKKLSIDKNKSLRNTISKSKESAREKSLDNSTSKRENKEIRTSKSFSGEINLNGIILQRFVDHYENSQNNILNFYSVKPVTRAVLDYPTLGFENGSLAQTTREIASRQNSQPETNGRALATGMRSAKTFLYIYTRIAASIWLSTAAYYVSQNPVKDVNELKLRIDSTFDEMDKDYRFLFKVTQMTSRIYDGLSCAPFLRPAKDFKGGEIECGSFAYRGDKFYVENQETLSENSIAGMSFKISTTSDKSYSHSVEVASTKSNRITNSTRISTSEENSDELSKGASMSKTKSSSMSDSSDDRQSTGSDLKGVKQ